MPAFDHVLRNLTTSRHYIKHRVVRVLSLPARHGGQAADRHLFQAVFFFLPGTVEEAFEEVGGAVEGGELACVEGAEARGQVANSAAAALLQDANSLWGGVEAKGAAVAKVNSAPRQALAFKADDDTGHSGRFDLLSSSQYFERKRPSKDQNRKS